MYTVTHIITSFSPDNPHFMSLMLGFAAANLIGLLEYFWAVALTVKEKHVPCPTWMHTFFLAHDSTAAIVFTALAWQHHFFWVFSVYAVGMYTWSLMEIFCLYMEIKYEREAAFGNLKDIPVSVGQAVTQVFTELIVMYVIINLLRYLTHDQAMFIWLPLTNFVMAIGPGYVLQKRQSRQGSSVMIYIFIILGTLLNFAPKGIGFFASILPNIFNQPIWFVTGLIATIIAIINLITIWRLPAKSKPAIW